MATFKKDKGLWEARRRLTHPDGSKSRQSFYGETADEAEDLAEAYKAKVLGIQPDDLFQSFAIHQYLPTVQNHSYKWREQIRWALNTHILPRYGLVPIKEIDRSGIQQWINELLAAGKKVVVKEGDRKLIKYVPLGRETVDHIRKVFGAVMNLAEADDVIPKNPIRHVKLPPDREPKKKPIYDPVECANLVAGAMLTVIAVPAFLGAFLGLRRGEALALMRTDIRRTKNGNPLVCIEWQMQKQSGKLVRTRPKTKSSIRELPVPGSFLRLLDAIAEEDTLFYCPNTDGQILNPENVDRSLYAVQDRLKLKRVTFHALRHSFSSNLADLGCPEEIRSFLLGHGSSNVTRDYTQYGEDLIIGWLEKLLVASKIEEVLCA